MAEAQLADEPTARNSKRFPVKAKGETVSGESERRSTVSVRIINQQFRNTGDVELHSLFSGQDKVFGIAVFQVFQYRRKL